MLSPRKDIKKLAKKIDSLNQKIAKESQNSKFKSKSKSMQVERDGLLEQLSEKCTTLMRHPDKSKQSQTWTELKASGHFMVIASLPDLWRNIHKHHTTDLYVSVLDAVTNHFVDNSLKDNGFLPGYTRQPGNMETKARHEVLKGFITSYSKGEALSLGSNVKGHDSNKIANDFFQDQQCRLFTSSMEASVDSVEAFKVEYPDHFRAFTTYLYALRVNSARLQNCRQQYLDNDGIATCVDKLFEQPKEDSTIGDKLNTIVSAHGGEEGLEETLQGAFPEFFDEKVNPQGGGEVMGRVLKQLREPDAKDYAMSQLSIQLTTFYILHAKKFQKELIQKTLESIESDPNFNAAVDGTQDIKACAEGIISRLGASSQLDAAADETAQPGAEGGSASDEQVMDGVGDSTKPGTVYVNLSPKNRAQHVQTHYGNVTNVTDPLAEGPDNEPDYAHVRPFDLKDCMEKNRDLNLTLMACIASPNGNKLVKDTFTQNGPQTVQELIEQAVGEKRKCRGEVNKEGIILNRLEMAALVVSRKGYIGAEIPPNHQKTARQHKGAFITKVLEMPDDKVSSEVKDYIRKNPDFGQKPSTPTPARSG